MIARRAYPAWSHGRVYYDLCKHLHERGYITHVHPLELWLVSYLVHHPQAKYYSVGVNRVRVEPGKLPTPPHSHGASEELYFVLAGSGLAWQDGAVHEVRPLDCVVHRADEHEHTVADTRPS